MQTRIYYNSNKCFPIFFKSWIAAAPNVTKRQMKKISSPRVTIRFKIILGWKRPVSTTIPLYSVQACDWIVIMPVSLSAILMEQLNSVHLTGNRAKIMQREKKALSKFWKRLAARKRYRAKNTERWESTDRFKKSASISKRTKRAKSGSQGQNLAQAGPNRKLSNPERPKNKTVARKIKVVTKIWSKGATSSIRLT